MLVRVGVEEFMEGQYVKYIDNDGGVNPKMRRNTPQALAHFSHQFFKEQKLLCDLQGVGDIYTVLEHFFPH